MYPSKHDRKRYRYTLKCFNTVKRLSTVRRIFSLWFEISFAIKWQHLPERVWTDRTWNKGRTTDNVRSKTGVVWSHPWMVGHVLCSLLARGSRKKGNCYSDPVANNLRVFFNKVFFILKTGVTRTKYLTPLFLKRASFRLQDLRHSLDHLEVGQLNSNR